MRRRSGSFSRANSTAKTLPPSTASTLNSNPAHSGALGVEVIVRQLGLDRNRFAPAGASLILGADIHQRVPQIQQPLREIGVYLERFAIVDDRVSHLAASLADETGVVEKFRAALAAIDQLLVQLESLLIVAFVQAQGGYPAKRVHRAGLGGEHALKRTA